MQTKDEITPLYILEKYFVTDTESRLDRDEVLTFFQSKLRDPNFSAKRLSRYLKDGSRGQIVKMAERAKKEQFPSGYSYRHIAYKDVFERDINSESTPNAENDDSEQDLNLKVLEQMWQDIEDIKKTQLTILRKLELHILKNKI